VVKELCEAGYHGFLVANFRSSSSQDIAKALFAAERFPLAAGRTGRHV
jgi:hypothetical protein